MVNGGTYVWDRANRLLSFGGAIHVYDGEGRRVRQTVGVQVTQYLLDLQPGLSVVLSATQGANVERYIHAPTGIFARKDSAGAWHWTEQDALGTVRGEVVDHSGSLLWMSHYADFGSGFGSGGTAQTVYGFTGDMLDGGGLLDLRARRRD